jgi:hypothetical protein
MRREVQRSCSHSKACKRKVACSDQGKYEYWCAVLKSDHTFTENDRPYLPADPVTACYFVGLPVEFSARIDPQQTTDCACKDYMFAGVHHTKLLPQQAHFDSKLKKKNPFNSTCFQNSPTCTATPVISHWAGTTILFPSDQ